MNHVPLPSDRRRVLSVVVLIIFKFLQIVLLLAVLGTLAFGLVEAGMSVFHLARGVPVEGRVTHIDQVDPGTASRTSDPFRRGARFPTISYSWPPEGGSPRWVRSLIPRGDLALSDSVTVRVIPGYENMARADRSPLYYVIVAVALLGGLVFTWILFSSWYAPEVSLGRDPERGISIFSGLAGKVLIVGLGGPAVTLLLFHLYYVPWLQLNEYVAFFDRPERLLYLAAERGGPPVDGPLNDYERRLLSIPILGSGISQLALNRAFSQRDADDIQRFIDAIKDPEIDFAVDMGRVPHRMVSGPPDRLRRFLETGIALPLEVKLLMLDQAEGFNNPEKLEILAEFGITRAAATP